MWSSWYEMRAYLNSIRITHVVILVRKKAKGMLDGPMTETRQKSLAMDSAAGTYILTYATTRSRVTCDHDQPSSGLPPRAVRCGAAGDSPYKCLP